MQAPHTHDAISADDHFDVAVIGGGVIGLSLAWELLRRDARVVLVDRGEIEPGRIDSRSRSDQSSWAAAGILPPSNFDRATDPIDRLRGYSHALWPLWCNQLLDATGIDPGLRRCGGLYLAESRGEAALMAGMIAYWRELNVDCQPISVEQLRSRFPYLRDWIADHAWLNRSADPVAGWWLADEYQVRPPRLLAALARACRNAGGRLIERVTVGDVRQSSDRITLDGLPGVTADQVVLCGGAATGHIAGSLGLETSLVPVRGQMLLLHHDQWTRDEVINVGNQYVLGRGDGHVLIGSCEEEVGFQNGTTDAVIDSLRAFAGRLCPPLRDARELQRWSGLRPMTFDGFPMLGRLPGHRRIHVATGHYRSGIALAPATAVAMADHLQNRTSVLDLQPFQPRQLAHETSPDHD